MFWIIGVRDIANGLAGLKVPWALALTAQLYHSKWNGFTFYDLIFPMFIFIIGASLVLSVQKKLESGERRKVIVKHVLMRTAAMFLLGLVYNDFISNWPHLEDIRIMGVLQRSAICYLVASMLVLYTKPRTQSLSALGILVGYGVVMRFIPVPGSGAGVWTATGSLVHYIDSLLLPGKLDYGSWDSEGLLSTMPAIATCLLGVMSGRWLGSANSFFNRSLDSKQRVKYLFLAGLVLAVVGLIISPLFPINKKLWTSSFVLLTGGLSAILLAIFSWLIDIRGYRRWSFLFVTIGMNSVFIYMAERFLPFDKIVTWIMGGKILATFGSGQTLFSAMAQLLLEVLLLIFLYNRKIFIRI